MGASIRGSESAGSTRRPAVRGGGRRIELGTDDRLPSAPRRAPGRARRCACAAPPRARAARRRPPRVGGDRPDPRDAPGFQGGRRRRGSGQHDRRRDLRRPRVPRRGTAREGGARVGGAAGDHRRRPRGEVRIPGRRARPAGRARRRDGRGRREHGAHELPRSAVRSILDVPVRVPPRERSVPRFGPALGPRDEGPAQGGGRGARGLGCARAG